MELKVWLDVGWILVMALSNYTGGNFLKTRKTHSSSVTVEKVGVQSGKNVTLPCSDPRPDSLDGLEWTRTDQDQYVYLYRDGKPDLTKQHQAYRGRCELWNSTASLVLQNVTETDDGRYECRVKHRSSGAFKRSIISSDPVCVVDLKVTQPGARTGAGKEKTEGRPPVETKRHHYVLLGVVGLFGLMAVILLYRYYQISSRRDGITF